MADSAPAPTDSSAAAAPPPLAADSSSSTTAATAQETPAPAADDHLARGIRSLALKKWNDACDELAQAVEASTEKHGELSPENVDALVLYGKALLGSAIAQSAVLGGGAPSGEVPEPGPSDSSASASASGSNAAAGPSKPNFHFGGDDEDEQGEGEGEDGEDGEEGGEEAPGADREDDLESAFQALEVARTILTTEVEELGTEIEKLLDSQEEKKRALEEKTKARKERLADVHRLLGDVATESEQFDGAVTEYDSALELLSSVLPPYDRALSELHMLIALALDFVPNATSRAVKHAMLAKDVLVLKLKELEKVEEGKREEKARREIEDIKGLMGDVDMKIEDLRTVPVAPTPTASDSALEALLRGSMSAMQSATASGQVNDLTGLVKKKKKPAAAAVKEEHVEGGKRGGEEDNVVHVAASAQGKEEDGEGKGKRKAEGENGEAEGEAKKQKVEA
ncbi:hypothetical protein JCM6882_007101 [Rhodosporidiobolus microsporus]